MKSKMRASEIVKIIKETIKFSENATAVYNGRIECLERLLKKIEEGKKEKPKDAIL